jgi:hypothetical protein
MGGGLEEVAKVRNIMKKNSITLKYVFTKNSN